MNFTQIIKIIIFSIAVLININYTYSQKVNSNTINILLLGDFYFGEIYQSNPKHNRGENIIEEYGYDYMFENISSLLEKSDMTIANLETDYKVRYLNSDEVSDCYNILKEKSIDKIIFNDEFRIKENEETRFFEIQLN